MIYCTVINNQYLPLALLMAKSVKEHNPQAKVAVCIIEEDTVHSRNHQYFDHIVLSKELGYDNFYRHMFKHNVVEGCCSVKARFLLYLYHIYRTEETFVYLDPDIKVFGPLHEVNRMLDQFSIIVTPHLSKPAVDDEIFISTSGLYNLGFLALKKSEESIRFLQWWNERLDRACYVEEQRNFFFDQKWMDYAPIFFHVGILRHPGYNVAWWNIHSRMISFARNGQIEINGKPLRFFHFSSIFRKSYSDLTYKLTPEQKERFLHLSHKYLLDLTHHGYDCSKKIRWDYDYYLSGEPIDMNARLVYRNNPERFDQIKNPFAMSNQTFLAHKS